MARVIYGVLDRKEFALYEHIEADRKKKHISGQTMAEQLGLNSRQAYSAKIKRRALSVRELLIAIKFLTWSNDEILYYLGTEAGRI